MAELPILLYPDPALRETCQLIEDIDERIRTIAADMVETVHAAPGVGLAAPQVGELVRLVVVDLSVGEDSSQLHVLVNPDIVSTEGEEVEANEGCLSFPDIFEMIKRPERVHVRALNIEGKEILFNAQDRLGRVLLHEIEHLDGKLFVDRLNRLKRELIKRRMKKRIKASPAA